MKTIFLSKPLSFLTLFVGVLAVNVVCASPSPRHSPSIPTADSRKAMLRADDEIPSSRGDASVFRDARSLEKGEGELSLDPGSALSSLELKEFRSLKIEIDETAGEVYLAGKVPTQCSGDFQIEAIRAKGPTLKAGFRISDATGRGRRCLYQTRGQSCSVIPCMSIQDLFQRDRDKFQARFQLPSNEIRKHQISIHARGNDRRLAWLDVGIVPTHRSSHQESRVVLVDHVIPEKTDSDSRPQPHAPSPAHSQKGGWKADPWGDTDHDDFASRRDDDVRVRPRVQPPMPQTRQPNFRPQAGTQNRPPFVQNNRAPMNRNNFPNGNQYRPQNPNMNRNNNFSHNNRNQPQFAGNTRCQIHEVGCFPMNNNRVDPCNGCDIIEEIIYVIPQPVSACGGCHLVQQPNMVMPQTIPMPHQQQGWPMPQQGAWPMQQRMPAQQTWPQQYPQRYPQQGAFPSQQYRPQAFQGRQSSCSQCSSLRPPQGLPNMMPPRAPYPMPARPPMNGGWNGGSRGQCNTCGISPQPYPMNRPQPMPFPQQRYGGVAGNFYPQVNQNSLNLGVRFNWNN